MTQTDQVNPLQSVWMKGKRQVKEGDLSLETIETWMVYVCHSEHAFERGMVVGAFQRKIHTTIYIYISL